MKKTKLILLALLLATGFFFSTVNTWAQTKTDAAPAFDQQPSIILDLWNNGGKGKYKDYVKFTNATLNQNISLNVYGYEQKPGKWTLIGVARLKNHCDFDTIDSPWKGRMNEFRWLAVFSSDNIKFDAQAMPYRNDISVIIFENVSTGAGGNKLQSNDTIPVFNMSSSVVLDLWENGGKGKYKDNVKLTNGTKNQNISFNIYGYDQKNNQWIIIGPSKISNTDTADSPWGWLAGDTDTVTSPWNGKLNEFRWLAVHSLNNIPFNAQAVANKNDINVMIIDK
jgi:hypothetical protein